MKFEKFVKSIGTQGIVYKRPNGEQWLASGSTYMLIPEDIKSITAFEIFDMPKSIEEIIRCDTFAEPCELWKAIMPYPAAVIKDCIRVYATANELCKIAISNDPYTLIQKGDFTEVYAKFDPLTQKHTGKALLIKRHPVLKSDDLKLVGLIFPTPNEEA